MPRSFIRFVCSIWNFRPIIGCSNLVRGSGTFACSIWLAACMGIAVVTSGCGQEPVTDPAVPTGKTLSANPTKDASNASTGEKQADHDDVSAPKNMLTGAAVDGKTAEPPADDQTATTAADGATKTAETDTTSTTLLKLAGIEIDVPEAWTRVDPPTVRIVDAEFMIPRLTADGFDGRLTFMAAGGDFDSNVSRWSGEFDREGGGPPGIETLSTPATDTRIVDLQGTWKGPTFQQPGQPRQASRSNYRMLAAVVPFSTRSSYFMKFVGPAELLEKHEAAFRKLVETARLQK